MTVPGRNDPCPCGSGKKFKKCCKPKQNTSWDGDASWLKIRRTEGELVNRLIKHGQRFFGPQALQEAWDEFTIWNEWPLDPESDLEPAFLPWFLFNWIPDNEDLALNFYEKWGDDCRDQPPQFPESSIARHYLENRSFEIDGFQRKFIEEACSQQYSFFMVKDVVPGESLALRDMMQQVDVEVHERTASQILSKGSILFGRIITIDNDTVFLGLSGLTIPPQFFSDVVDFRKSITRNHPNINPKMLWDFDLELRRFFLDLREESLNPTLPKLHNTNGDVLQFFQLIYLLKCTPDEALEALFSLSMEKDITQLLHDARFDDDGKLIAVNFPWLKAGNKKHPEWENTIFGQLFIEGNKLKVEVNSQERVDEIQRKLKKRLGKRAVFQNTVVESADFMLKKAAANPDEEKMRLHDERQAEILKDPAVLEKLKEMSVAHWKAWIDTKIPALDGKTPIEAAKSNEGRELLDGLLLSFEGQNEAQDIFRPDFVWLRKTLGLKT